MVVVGDTVLGLSVLPSFQTYVAAPLAVSIVLSPLQIVPAEGFTITVGSALIVKLNVAVAESVSV